MPLNDGTEIAELHESNVYEIQSLRSQYKAALELIEELEATVAELLAALEQAIADIERTGYVSVPTCILMEEAIRKAKENKS